MKFTILVKGRGQSLVANPNDIRGDVIIFGEYQSGSGYDSASAGIFGPITKLG